MKIEKELLEDHQIKLNVETDAEPLESAKRRAARKIAKRIKIPGFRPGKAPYNVVLRHVGEGAIVEEAMDFLIEDIYPKVVEESEINPYGPGALEEIPSLDPPTFIFKIPLEPEVELGDYKALEIEYAPPVVSDEDIEARLAELQQQQAVTEQSESPAEEGDRVFFQISAQRAEVTEGEDAEVFPDRFNSSVIEAEGEEVNQWPFPGFGRQLIGLSIDDEKDIVYTYPEDHEDENLQGVEAVFHIVITNIQQVSLPELDDEFAKAASDFDTMEELHADIRSGLEQASATEYDAEYNDSVIDTLVEQSTVSYPPQMLDQEKKELLSGLEYRLSQQGITKELYLQIRNQTEEDLDEEVAPVAQTRVERALVLMEVAKAEDLQVNQEELMSEAGRTYEAITRGMSPKDAKDFQKSGYLNNLMTSIMADMLTNSAVDYLRAVAKGDPIPEPEAEEETAEEQKENTDITPEPSVSEDEATSETSQEEEPVASPEEDDTASEDEETDEPEE